VSASIEGPSVLESGDRLTRDEFHRRYCDRPDIRKAELVMGVVYVASPARIRQHGAPHGLLVGWLAAVVAQTPGLRLAVEGTVYLDEFSEVQPDACLFWDPPRAGSGHLNEDGYFEGAPLVVAEVAASSASYDLHDKKEAYRRAGVPVYIVWRVLDGRVDWFELRGDQYVPLEPDEHGIITSAVLPSLRLLVPAMLAEDYAAVLAAVGLGA
jgi:Uma2 family endonuclease